jgi:hypothetical protein
MDPNEKIQLDDITFDDVVLGDGVETVSIDDTAETKTEEATKETTEEEVVDEVEETEEEEIEEEDDDEEYEEDENDDDDDVEPSEKSDTVVGEILNALGYEVEEEYADTAEGLTEMTKDIASQMADDRLDEVLEAFPLVKDHLQYVLAGGQSQDFMQAHDPNLDYSGFTLAEDDVRSQKAILSDYFKVKGHDNDFINEMLEDYEDSGKLHNKAEAARQALGKAQEQRNSQLVEQQNQMRYQQMQEQETFWSGVADTIKESKEFAGLQVPEREKSKFFNYLSQPVSRDGRTQRDLDHAGADMDVKLAIDYLMFKGFNLDTIIDKKAKTKQTKSLRDKIAKSEASVKSARKASRSRKSFDIDDLDLSI